MVVVVNIKKVYSQMDSGNAWFFVNKSSTYHEHPISRFRIRDFRGSYILMSKIDDLRGNRRSELRNIDHPAKEDHMKEDVRKVQAHWHPLQVSA